MILELNKWVKFILGCISITTFIWIVPIGCKKLPNYRELTKIVNEKGIDVSALFYSDEKHTYTSQKAIMESRKE